MQHWEFVVCCPKLFFREGAAGAKSPIGDLPPTHLARTLEGATPATVTFQMRPVRILKAKRLSQSDLKSEFQMRKSKRVRFQIRPIHISDAVGVKRAPGDRRGRQCGIQVFQCQLSANKVPVKAVFRCFSVFLSVSRKERRKARRAFI